MCIVGEGGTHLGLLRDGGRGRIASVSYSTDTHISKGQYYMQLLSNKIVGKGFFHSCSDNIVCFYVIFSNWMDSGEKHLNVLVCSCWPPRKSYFHR